MPTLKWIGKDKVINYHNEVPFRLLKEKKSLSVNSNDTGNLLIKGDNLEALKALLPYYYNKIKAIYIDPPYNTGNEGWIYNDNVNAPEIKKWLGKVVGGEAEDLSRHDKWLCMMYPRLRLLSELLNEDGVIFISIDDNEVHSLRMLLDELFGRENFLCIITWQGMDTIKNDARYFSSNTEYIIAYAKSIDNVKIKGIRKGEKQRGVYKNYDNDPRGPYLLTPLHAKSGSEAGVYEFTFPNGQVWRAPKGTYPRFSKETLTQLIRDGRIYLDREGKKVPQKKTYLSEVSERMRPWTFWKYEDFGSTRQANAELREILGRGKFQNPKPSKLVRQIIDLVADNNSLIIDSFAGSGTTGHAVLALNKEDGGNRKFILVECEDSIAKDITAERLKRVIRGYSYKKSNGEKVEVEGLGGGFKFLELGNPLFDKHKQIIGQPSYKDLAGYIYFTETRCTIDWRKANREDWYVGESSGIHYFIIYGEKSDLDEGFVEIAKRYEGKKVVYADAVMVDDDELERFGIVFKQIPYEIRTF